MNTQPCYADQKPELDPCLSYLMEDERGALFLEWTGTVFHTLWFTDDSAAIAYVEARRIPFRHLSFVAEGIRG